MVNGALVGLMLYLVQLRDMMMQYEDFTTIVR